MTENIDKAGVLKEMSTSYATLEAILASLDKTQYFIEGVIPGWSIKDILAHISSWHHRLYQFLDAALYNQEPAISGPDNMKSWTHSMHNFISRTNHSPSMRCW